MSVALGKTLKGTRRSAIRSDTPPGEGMKEQIDNYLGKLTATIDNLDREEIEKCAEVLLKAYWSGNQIFVCGNGGSAATASHFAVDINKGVSLGLERKFRVIPLTDNMATITAYTNDLNYDVIFVEQLKNYFREGDVVIGISGSGNSKNVLNAIAYANENGGVTVGWTGYLGGRLKEMSQYSINANVEDMQLSEDIHMISTHLMMKTLCSKLGAAECSA